MKKAIYLLAILFSQVSFAQNTPIFPKRNWTEITDKSEWNVERLNSLTNFLKDSSNTSGMMVVHKGKVLLNYGNTKELSYLASARKSVLSMLYGPYVASGKIDLNKTIEDLGLDDIQGLLPSEKKATIKDLLTARSGVYHPASNQGDATDKAPARGSVEHGTYWLYNNWDFNMAGHILEKETGNNIYNLVGKTLARPLKMQDWRRYRQLKTGDTKRSKYKAYHMWFSTRDMAKIGYLMLNNGSWNGKQIIPTEWVKTTTTIVTSNAEAKKNKLQYYDFGYGYLWWIWDIPHNKGYYEGAYTASGAFGQFITVIPKLDLVIAHKTKTKENDKQTSMDTYLKIVDKIIQAKI